jgi:hypothetical protein
MWSPYAGVAGGDEVIVTWSQAGLPTDSLAADRVWVCTLDEYRSDQLDARPEVVYQACRPPGRVDTSDEFEAAAAGVRTGCGAREAAAGCCQWAGRLGQVQATLAIASRSIIWTTIPTM